MAAAEVPSSAGWSLFMNPCLWAFSLSFSASRRMLSNSSWRVRYSWYASFSGAMTTRCFARRSSISSALMGTASLVVMFVYVCH